MMTAYGLTSLELYRGIKFEMANRKSNKGMGKKIIDFLTLIFQICHYRIKAFLIELFSPSIGIVNIVNLSSEHLNDQVKLYLQWEIFGYTTLLAYCFSRTI